MFREKLTEYCNNLSSLLSQSEVTDQHGGTMPLDEGAGNVVNMILSVKLDNRKVMVIGNGGSAAIASHTQNDLCKAVGVRALVFDDTSLLTALSNDHGYGCVYERPIKLWAEKGDLLIAISSSGQSENIIRAVKAAEKYGCGIITLSGFKPDNPLRAMGSINFYVPVADYGYVESAHAILTHFFTDNAMTRGRKAGISVKPSTKKYRPKIVNIPKAQQSLIS